MKPATDILSQLGELISYPTVSSDSRSTMAIRKCAKWIMNYFKKIGFTRALVYETSSHPVVYAEYISNPLSRTLLFYGHYDVQPPDPLDKWTYPPFSPTLKGNYLFGRGASDDKGQFFIHLKAAEALLKSGSLLNVNLKFLIEGAEEIGSPGLADFISNNRDLLRCDAAIVSDTKMASINTPAITYSLRGALNAQIDLQVLKKDLHSGTFGGMAANAGLVTSQLVQKLYRVNHNIAIPGLYDAVRRIPEEERIFMRNNGPSSTQLCNDGELNVVWGEINFSAYERTTIRPSLAVTGITCGYQGQGVKNVIPASALVKLNFRLVPDQDPDKIKVLLNNYLKKVLPKHVNFKITFSSSAKPVTVSRNNPYLLAAVEAYKTIFNQDVMLLRSGGTIPAVQHLSSMLNIPVVMMGFALGSDNIHAPNEKFYLPNLYKGINTIIHLIRRVGEFRNREFLN
jgi:acetylornithine deacetylase/succinyl-diaminopimelate desuccinylase-like protein